ncbi:MAG: hypothetical protein FWG72_06205 [Oscillospiraceae bacterium]|nr:hypothetical protein [Oscillospiraceae bacterium]
MAVLNRRGSIAGTVAFSIRIAPEVKQELENLAYEERKAYGWLAAELLEEALRERRKAAAS